MKAAKEGGLQTLSSTPELSLCCRTAESLGFGHAKAQDALYKELEQHANKLSKEVERMHTQVLANAMLCRSEEPGLRPLVLG